MKNVFLFAFILTSVVVKAQNPLDLTYYLSQNVNYNAAIPTPKSVLGFEVGEMHSSHDKLVAYMKLLANVSNKISIEDRGKIFEGRPFLFLQENPRILHNFYWVVQLRINTCNPS